MKTIWIWLFLATVTRAQTIAPRTVVGLSLLASTGEKRSYFLAGEAIETQYKVFNALTHQPDSLDAPLYVDWIDNQHGKLLRHLILKPKKGIAHFTLVLPDSLPSGYYQLRAYTNWMRNFSPDAFGRVNMLIVSQNYKQTLPSIIPKATVGSLKAGLEGGTLVTNLQNHLVVCTSDSFNRPILCSGFISRSLGDTLARFQTDSAGQATLDFVPQKNTNYWVQAGTIRLPLMTNQPTGSVLRCDDVTYPDRVRVTVENQYGDQRDSLMLVVHNRGKVHSYVRIPMQAPVTVIYLARSALQEGITVLSLLDQHNQLINERMIYQGPSPALDAYAWNWLNAELNEPIYLVKPRQISQALVLRQNTLFGWNELTRARTYSFAPESGITITGRVTKWNRKPLTQPVTVSLLAQPVEPDSSRSESLLFAETNPTGQFRFENVSMYGTYKAVFTAKVGNTNGYITLDSTTIPPINVHLQPIDWQQLMDSKEQRSDIERIAKIHAKRQVEGITLQAVTVKAMANPTRQRTFVGPPSMRLDKAKLLSTGGNNLDIIFSRYINPRANKLGGKALLMVDDVPIKYGFELPAVGIIDHINVYDQTGDAFYYGVDLVVAIYTVFHPSAQNVDSPGKQIKIVGFQRD